MLKKEFIETLDKEVNVTWLVLDEIDEYVLLSDGSDQKWVRREVLDEVQELMSFRQYYMSLDMKSPICGL